MYSHRRPGSIRITEVRTISCSKILNIILDFLYPPRCVFCRTMLKSGEIGFCNDCQQKLPWLTGKEAEQKFEFVTLCVSPLRYQGEVRESIHRYKFEDRSGYAKVYGTLIAQCVSDHFTDQFDLISWVPLSPKRFKKRGYDQAMLLAKETAVNLNATAVATLRKIRDTDAQSGINDDSARRANVLGAYEVIDPELIIGKRILLIDDVATTGSTLSECARVLRTYGAKDVVCASLARARG